MAEYGIRVSKPNKNVLDATVRDLMLDTSYPLLKIKMSGSGVLNVTDGGSDINTITHNLGYVPRILVFGQVHKLGVGKDPSFLRYPYIAQLVGIYASSFTYDITPTELKIMGSFNDTGYGTETFDYFYYLFYDEK